MLPQQPAYLSYLLRLWRAPGGVDQPWRGSLQDTLTGERKGFADPEALFAFLLTQIEARPLPGEKSGEFETVN